jgi:hypothetical protein
VGDFPVLLNEHVYSITGGSKFGWDPCAKRSTWDEVNYDRCAWASNPIASNRLLAENSMKGLGVKGFGRIGADFWPLGLKGSESRGFVANRYPESIRIAREITSGWLSPGPDGAVSSVRFEMGREGVQELEARIFIEKNVLADAGGRAKVGEELAKRCEELLAERDKAMRSPLMEGAASLSVCYPASGWQERSGKLFALAAEVAAKLGR